MKTIEPVTIDQLQELLDYDPETGDLRWKPRAGQNAWNAKHARTAAMNTKHSEGYLIGKITGRRVYAHRVAFAIHHGRWPAGLIDHINGDRTDNRADNLREVDLSENAKNRRAGLRQSGHAGIWWIEGAQRWRVVHRHNKRRYNIGSYATLDEAIEAMRETLTKVHGAQDNKRP
jgi:hypothetical protein